MGDGHDKRQQAKCAGATRWDTDCVKVHALMAATNRPTLEPPHDSAGSIVFADRHAGCESYDDISGAPLAHAMATAVRKTEIANLQDERGLHESSAAAVDDDNLHEVA